MTNLLNVIIVVLSITILLCVYRAIAGPTQADRIIAINIIGTKIISIIIIVSFLLHESYFIDVALVYALISFSASIIISKVIKEQ
jgi:multicomponent Na+:H+ antiporter subunit F